MEPVEVLKALLLGAVEGFTQWLPVSSTAHQALLDELIRLDAREEFQAVFSVMIQLGTVFAVLLIFRERLWPFCSRPLTDNEAKALRSQPAPVRVIRTAMLRYFDPDICSLWLRILIASLPAFILGLAFYDLITVKCTHLVIIAFVLILYGIVFVLLRRILYGRRPTVRQPGQISLSKALIIGLFQSLSMVPGTSRTGAAILGGMFVRTSRIVATEFSYYLSVPAIFGSCIYRLSRFALSFSGWEVLLLFCGMLTAFITSLVSIRFMLSYIRKHNFRIFGWYRIGLGIFILLYYILLNHILN
ncbi:MAG: undecaprenyl-diphosphate phosphatase [Blautia sp.]|nr:undecaprenyl-diphosphate phosphatase [Blautia sp.]